MGEQMTIKDVFRQSQTGLQGHGKLMKTLNKIYDKTEFDTFWAEFVRCLKYAMIVFKREPAVERVIDFVAKFVPSLRKTEKGGGDALARDCDNEQEDSVAQNRLLQEMFDFLLSSHSARDRGVRFRCCQLVNKLLTNLGEDAQIGDELYDHLYECMLERLKDKCPVVRYHAVLAMVRLQDPSDENCPVIKAYLFLLNCDPNPDVRRAVLSSIAPSTKTLASIVGRTRDVKDTVRKTAYEVLSEKIHIKALSIALRLQLVNEGLNDRAENVRQACSGKLLQTWLHTFNGDILQLLRSLDVEDSTDICSRVLEALFKAASVQDVIERFNILNDSLLVPVEQLSSETALYWQMVCKYFHGMGTDGEEHKEKVMPTVVDFCAYMQRYIEGLKTVTDPEIQLSTEFVIEQLLMLTNYMDTADSASRKALDSLLHNMIMADHVSHRLVKSIVKRVCSLRGATESMVPYFAELVSEIREPITIVDRDMEVEQKKQINLKIAGIRVQLNELREDLDTAVRNQDFTKAAELKSTVAELDAEKVKLLQTSEPVREEVRSENNDPLTVLKCQTIIVEMLQLLKLTAVSPTLQMLIESQIVPGIQNEDAQVRNMAMQALGLCCYVSKDLLVTYIPLFMQASQIDVELVRVSALQILFDLLLVYGLEIVDSSEGSASECSDDQRANQADDEDLSVVAESNCSNGNGIASKLVAIICSFLDGESCDLRTCGAEGLCKLLLSGRVVSSKILSHLILLWYNPLSEDDTHLRDCLGLFFPMYALASRSNQQVVEEAFLPTLRTLLNAPSTSPLAEVDVKNVAELLVQLTNTKLITVNQNKKDISLDNPGHDNLSEIICNEILSNPESSNVKLWVGILNQLEVSPNNEVVLKDLKVLCYKMLKVVKEKSCQTGLQKFQTTITELASKFIGDDTDLNSIAIEVSKNTDQETESTSDTTIQTPRRKKIRGLYTHNQTLGMESESELDITQDALIEVDASCLMSRVTSDTPPPKMRKKAATAELANGVFTIPEAPESVEKTSVAKRLDTESEPQQDHNKDSRSDTVEESPTIRGSKAPESTTMEQIETSTKSPDIVTEESSSESVLKKDCKKSVSLSLKKRKTASEISETHEKRSRLSKRQLPISVSTSEKRKAPISPPFVLLEKRRASESPARVSFDKRKASESPSVQKKRSSKSPRMEAKPREDFSDSPENETSMSQKKQKSPALTRNTSATSTRPKPRLAEEASKPRQKGNKIVPAKVMEKKFLKTMLPNGKTVSSRVSEVASKSSTVRKMDNKNASTGNVGKAVAKPLEQKIVCRASPRISLRKMTSVDIAKSLTSVTTKKNNIEDKIVAQKSVKSVGVFRFPSKKPMNTSEITSVGISPKLVVVTPESRSSRRQQPISVSFEKTPEHQLSKKPARKVTPKSDVVARSRSIMSVVKSPDANSTSTHPHRQKAGKDKSVVETTGAIYSPSTHTTCKKSGKDKVVVESPNAKSSPGTRSTHLMAGKGKSVVKTPDVPSLHSPRLKVVKAQSVIKAPSPSTCSIHQKAATDKSLVETPDVDSSPSQRPSRPSIGKDKSVVEKPGVGSAQSSSSNRPKAGIDKTAVRRETRSSPRTYLTLHKEQRDKSISASSIHMRPMHQMIATTNVESVASTKALQGKQKPSSLQVKHNFAKTLKTGKANREKSTSAGTGETGDSFCKSVDAVSEEKPADDQLLHTDEEEDNGFRRRARPSRKSAQAGASPGSSTLSLISQTLVSPGNSRESISSGTSVTSSAGKQKANHKSGSAKRMPRNV